MARIAAHSDRHTADRIAAAVVLILAIVLFIVSARYGFTGNDRPGPGMFPGIIAGALGVVSFLWLITGAGAPLAEDSGTTESNEARESVEQLLLKEKTSLDELDDDSSAADVVDIDRAGAIRIAAVILWTAVPLFLFDRLGYIITITLYVGGLLIAIARVRPWVAIVGAVVGAVLTAIGGDALGIRFPDPFHLLRMLGR